MLKRNDVIKTEITEKKLFEKCESRVENQNTIKSPL
jgi:hypothetical protein